MAKSLQIVKRNLSIRPKKVVHTQDREAETVGQVAPQLTILLNHHCWTIPAAQIVDIKPGNKATSRAQLVDFTAISDFIFQGNINHNNSVP